MVLSCTITSKRGASMKQDTVTGMEYNFRKKKTKR